MDGNELSAWLGDRVVLLLLVVCELNGLLKDFFFRDLKWLERLLCWSCCKGRGGDRSADQTVADKAKQAQEVFHRWVGGLCGLWRGF